MGGLKKWGSVVFAGLLVAAAAWLPSAAQQRRADTVDDSDVVQVPGNVHALAQPQFIVGAPDFDAPMERMVLTLRMRPDAQARLSRLLVEQQDPSSANYHKWLTPEQFGAQFGPTPAQLRLVSTWLIRNGFRIDDVAKSGLWINFSGTVGSVERTFRTQIRTLDVAGRLHQANIADPSIPRALAGIVHGVVTMHDFRRTPMNHGFRPLPAGAVSVVAPNYTSGSSHYLAPADFATIYNVKALYDAGYTGSGQTIAIVGRTDIHIADVQYFRSYFGLPANDPVTVHNGTAPGVVDSGEEGEALLDLEWSGAVAKNATIKFVVTKSTNTTDGVDLSAQYIVNNNVAPVMSTSFGACESAIGTSENNFFNNLWQQAAAQGITSFVSSGDSGASGCDGGSATSGSGRAISGLCSTPYDVCVGGSMFDDASNPSAYWASTNDATTHGSALSYIPEKVWNESANVSGGSGLWATGGGASSVYSKPSWQVATGVPSDGKRDVPDVSLTAAGYDGYIIVQGHTSSASGLTVTGGTSASSPSFAGLMALINQKTATTQGNANVRFYQLGAAQYGGSGATVFHDVTSGNNSVPGVTGYTAGTGYDLATGLGTVDAKALADNWAGQATPDFAVTVSPSSVSATVGGQTTATVTTTVSGGFNSAVSLSVSGLPTGATATFSPASIAAPGSGSSTLTLATGTAAAGTYSLTITATGNGTTHAAALSFAINAVQTTYSISGAVTLNGAGLSGVTVGAGSASAATDANGAYTISGLANGTYTLTPSKTGYTFSPATQSVAVSGADVTGKNFTATATTGDTALTSGVAVAGSITSTSRNGAWNYYYIDVPSGATSLAVTMTGLSADADLYDMFNAKPTTSSYTSRSWNSGTTSESITNSSPSAGRWYIGVTNYATGTITYTIKATVTTPAATYTVSGTVTLNGAGLSGATVSSGSASATTDANGAYTISGLANGTYTLTPSKSGYTFTPTSQSVTVNGANLTGKNFTATVAPAGLTDGDFEGGLYGSSSTGASGTTGPWAWTSTGGKNPIQTGSSKAHAGSWFAVMNGYGKSETDTLSQTATIPVSSTAKLNFYLKVTTSDGTSKAYDKLTVYLIDQNGASHQLVQYSNVNAKTSGYALKSLSVSAYQGQTVTIKFSATEDSSLSTYFYIDDVALAN